MTKQISGQFPRCQKFLTASSIPFMCSIKLYSQIMLFYFFSWRWDWRVEWVPFMLSAWLKSDPVLSNGALVSPSSDLTKIGTWPSLPRLIINKSVLKPKFVILILLFSQFCLKHLVILISIISVINLAVNIPHLSFLSWCVYISMLYFYTKLNCVFVNFSFKNMISIIGAFNCKISPVTICLVTIFSFWANKNWNKNCKRRCLFPTIGKVLFCLKSDVLS